MTPTACLANRDGWELGGHCSPRSQTRFTAAGTPAQQDRLTPLTIKNTIKKVVDACCLGNSGEIPSFHVSEQGVADMSAPSRVFRAILVMLFAVFVVGNAAPASDPETLTSGSVQMRACDGAAPELANSGAPAFAVSDLALEYIPCCFYSNCPSCGHQGERQCCDGTCNCVCVPSCCSGFSCGEPT